MGNDFAKAHGISPGQAITKAQFDQIWCAPKRWSGILTHGRATVDTGHVGYIGRTEAEKFLKVPSLRRCTAANASPSSSQRQLRRGGVPPRATASSTMWRTRKVRLGGSVARLIASSPSGNVTKNLFHRLFFTAAQEMKVQRARALPTPPPLNFARIAGWSLRVPRLRVGDGDAGATLLPHPALGAPPCRLRHADPQCRAGAWRSDGASVAK